MFEFLSKGQISKSHPDLKEFINDPCLIRLSATDDTDYYTHNLLLSSAVEGSTLPFTNYTSVIFLEFLIFDNIFLIVISSFIYLSI